jgi:hypothetical protein
VIEALSRATRARAREREREREREVRLTKLCPGEDEGADLGSLLRWRPLGEHRVQRREGRALAETHEDPENDEGDAAPGLHRDRGKQGEDGRREDAQAQGVFAPEALGEHSTG